MGTIARPIVPFLLIELLLVNDELAVIQQYEPKLYTAAVNIFGKSYEYTRRYREFVKMMKEKEKMAKAA